MKTQAMLIPKYNGIHGCIDSRLVNGKSQSFYQMTDRYRIEIPIWMFFTEQRQEQQTNSKYWFPSYVTFFEYKSRRQTS